VEVGQFIVLEDGVAVSRAVGGETFVPDVRRVATVTGISIDNVNIALTMLLTRGRLRMISPVRWLIASGNRV
jgi:hypothetical protein